MNIKVHVSLAEPLATMPCLAAYEKRRVQRIVDGDEPLPRTAQCLVLLGDLRYVAKRPRVASLI
jgi:hypothetical protein